MTSPCKKCDKYSRLFPSCFNKCNTISNFQNILIGKSIEAEDYKDLTQDCLYKCEGIYRIDNLKLPQLDIQFY
jgi:hypothetical protein